MLGELGFTTVNVYVLIHIHDMIAVFLPSQSVAKKHIQFLKKSPYTFAHLMSNKQIFRCLFCVSCSVHVVFTCAKDHGPFLNLDYPQINEVRKFSMDVTTVLSCQTFMSSL